jgi:phosphopantothenoylcysteine decarboxylase/phosphopantothenate--cysteine ligase
MRKLSERKYRYGIFAAAVADYQAKEVYQGKMPSGSASKSIELKPTVKVIDDVLAKHPEVKLISFKLEVGATLKDFEKIAAARLKKGHFALVANEFSEVRSESHKAHLFTRNGLEKNLANRKEIVGALAALIENDLKPLS